MKPDMEISQYTEGKRSADHLTTGRYKNKQTKSLTVIPVLKLTEKAQVYWHFTGVKILK